MWQNLEASPNYVCPLNVEWVGIPGFEQMRQLGCNELSRLLVRPQLILIVWVHLLARPLCCLPFYWYMLILPGLVDDSRNSGLS